MLHVDISHRYSAFDLNVAFDAPNGITALFGKSGAGKTTVINAIAGVMAPDQGMIAHGETKWFNRQTGVNVPMHKRGIGYVFQESRLFPHMSVAANLTYSARYGRATQNEKRFSEIVDLLGIGHLLSRRPNDLSGGEKQRVAIARALLSDPQVLLMDEPLAALDDARKAEILPYLETLRDEMQIPMLYVSHSVSEIARLAGRVVVMDQGRITAQGPVLDIFSNADLAPQFGVRNAGAVMMGRVCAHEEDGLTRLYVAGGDVYLPKISVDVDKIVRLRILAQDVTIALDRPERTSALNILPATVRSLKSGGGPGMIVTLDVGGERILSRITSRSAQNLGLQSGMTCFAVIKSVSVSQSAIGG